MKFQLILTAILLPQIFYGQQLVQPLAVGNKIPDTVLVKMLDREPMQQLTTCGKPLLLDFWSIWCSGCISSMPKMDSLQTYFGNKLQIIFVTKNSKREVEQLFAKRKRFLPKKIPMVIEDVYLSRLFPHESVPHLVWIDEKGIVRYITYSHNATKDNLEAFLLHRPLAFLEKRTTKSLDVKIPFWQQDDGSFTSAVKYYSVFAKRVEGLIGGMSAQKESGMFRRLRLINMPLIQIYIKAYGGIDYQPEINGIQRVILEVRKPEVFVPSNKNGLDQWYSQNSFCYETMTPLSPETVVRKNLQGDLLRNFPYVAAIEKRWVKAMVLVRTDSSIKLNSTRGKYSYQYNQDSGRLQLHKAPISALLSTIRRVYQDFELPIIEEIGYKDLIDIDVHIPVNDMVALAAELNKWGLTVTIKEVELDMLVIRDKDSLVKVMK